MKEIIEGEITYIVSDNYPEIPYQKAAKGEAVKRKILTRYEFRSTPRRPPQCDTL